MFDGLALRPLIDQPQLAVGHQHRRLADHRIFGDAALEIGARPRRCALISPTRSMPRGAAAVGILVAQRPLGDLGDHADRDDAAADDAEEFSDRGARHAAGRGRRQADRDLRAADGDDAADAFRGGACAAGGRSVRRGCRWSCRSCRGRHRPRRSRDRPPDRTGHYIRNDLGVSVKAATRLRREPVVHREGPVNQARKHQPITMRVRGPTRAMQPPQRAGLSAPRSRRSAQSPAGPHGRTPRCRGRRSAAGCCGRAR